MVTYTSSSTYWSPLKPRIRIYAFSDSSYSSPLYTYNAFTDVGVDTKPIALNFDSQTVNVGSFSIEIEDTNSTLDPDTYVRGNRVFIECSKDGSTWQPAFKGLVRGVDQNIYATSGRNIVLNGYSYLVRLNERVLNIIKESSLTGDDYNRTDSTMFTNNLINNLLTTDSNYIHSVDDTQLYSIFKTANISGSPITEWIPRLDAQLVTVNDAINSILEFSNGLVMLNPSDDQLMLYTSDLVTSATGIFLLTNQMNQNADDADFTMYPLEPYRYNISYDYADSGSRLIGSIGEGAAGDPCPAGESEPIPATSASGHPFAYQTASCTSGQGPTCAATVANNYQRAWRGCIFKATQTDCTNLRIEVGNYGDLSAASSIPAQIRTYSALCTGPGSQIGSQMTLYRDREVSKPFPEFTSNNWLIGLPQGQTGVTGLTVGSLYWFIATGTTIDTYQAINPGGSATGQYLTWIGVPGAAVDKYSYAWCGEEVGDLSGPFPADPNVLSNWTETPGFTTPYEGQTECAGGTMNGPLTFYELHFNTGIAPECGGGGGSQATLEADPVFAIAHDRNMSGRIGIVERVISNIPQHIKTAQTLNEYLYNKLYFAAKPRFTFDFPSVSMCNKLPKAGDIVAHVDSMTNTGVRNGPVQTGVISSVQYNFEQGKGQDDALGLRRLSLSTTGIKRGSY